MTSTVERAAAFGLVGLLAFAVPLAGRVEDPALATLVAAGPFLVVAIAALTLVSEGTLFELFARPGDRRQGALYGLAGFALAAAGLAIMSVAFGLPPTAYVVAVVLLVGGNLGARIVPTVRDEPAVVAAGFVAGGFLAGTAAGLGASAILGRPAPIATVAFLAAAGSLIAALIREVLFQQDDPLVLVAVALLLWLFISLPGGASPTRVAVALAVTAGLGYVSYALETASLPGMLTGILLGLLTIVLSDYGWFAMLIAFYGIGGLSAKFRYDEKVERGIAEPNEGARGSGNVLANSVAALAAVLLGAASPRLGVPMGLFLFAFAGAVAAALADTLSSEIGGLFDQPRLITNLDVVEPGQDGAVSVQGTAAGLAGAAIIAAIGATLLSGIGPAGAVVVAVAGTLGMIVDSLLGATLEGRLIGNQGVNFLATAAAGVAGAGLAVLVGLVAL
ncbi:MAG: TIGR00297 family protein [Salinirussus sp.]